VAFAWSSLRRLVLTDRDNVEHHGSVLAHDAARAVRCGDRFLARERLALTTHGSSAERPSGGGTPQLDSQRRRSRCKSRSAIRTLRTEGRHRRSSQMAPMGVPVRVALQLVPLLLSRGRKDAVLDVLEKRSSRSHGTCCWRFPRAGWLPGRSRTIGDGLKQVRPCSLSEGY